MVEISGRQSIGQRKSQQDHFDIVYDNKDDPNTNALLLMADGMGGHVGGDVAANIAVSEFAEHFTKRSRVTSPLKRLGDAVQAANRAIAQKIESNPDLSGMGCTFIGALKRQDRLYWASVGDSVVYLFRDGVLQRLNEDHSVLGELMELVAQGKLTEAEARQNPRRNALRSALIGGRIPMIDQNAIDLRKRDLVVIATDGLDSLDTEALSDLLATENLTDVRTLSAMLLQEVEALQKPRQDNTSVIVYRHKAVDGSSVASPSLWSSDQGHTQVRSIAFGLAILFGALAIAILTLVLAFRPDADPDISDPVTTRSTGGEISNQPLSPDRNGDVLGDDP